MADSFLTQVSDLALRVRAPYGVWGGPSEDERAGLLGSHRRATPNPRQCRDRRPWSAHTRAPASH